MKKKLRLSIILIFGIIVSIPAVLPLFREGFFVIHDNTQIERVFEITNSIADGQFPVRWVENLGYGYGYPIFNFYAPFAYYVGGFINLIINNSLLATKIMFGIGVIASFFSMYYLASRLTNVFGGITAGIVYLYFPYHALNIYVRGAVGEFFAYAFLPLAFLGIYKIYENTDNKKIPLITSILASIPISLIIISHNLTAYMLALMLGLFVLFLLVKTKSKEIFAKSIGIVLLFTFLISSFYVLPAVLETGFTNVESQVGGGADYPDHFVCVSQLWHSNWGFGGSIPGCTDGLSFSLGKVNILILSVAFLYLAYSYIKNRKITHEIIYWVLFVLSLFLLLPYSKPVWDILPFIEFLQYPWRFLNFAALFLSLITAFLIYKIKNKKALITIASIIVISVIYTNYQLFYPASFENNSNSYYEDLEHIRFETSKISDEYMPAGFDKPASASAVPQDLLEIESSGATAALINGKTGYYEFFKNGSRTEIHINKAYFPSWRTYVDGEEIDIESKNNGMSINLPEGEQNVVLKFTSTPVQLAGNILTIIGLLAVFAVIIVKRKKIHAKT